MLDKLFCGCYRVAAVSWVCDRLVGGWLIDLGLESWVESKLLWVAMCDFVLTVFWGWCVSHVYIAMSR